MLNSLLSLVDDGIGGSEKKAGWKEVSGAAFCPGETAARGSQASGVILLPWRRSSLRGDRQRGSGLV